MSVLLTITKVTERSSSFSGKIIPLLQLVLILAKSHQSIKSQGKRVKGKGKVSVDQPKVIAEYNKGIGGVDLFDMLLGSYRPNLRSKKWWWPLFANALNIAVVAAFKIHKKVCVDQLSHLDFRIEVAEVMVRANHEAQRV